MRKLNYESVKNFFIPDLNAVRLGDSLISTGIEFHISTILLK